METQPGGSVRTERIGESVVAVEREPIDGLSDHLGHTRSRLAFDEVLGPKPNGPAPEGEQAAFNYCQVRVPSEGHRKVEIVDVGHI